VQSCAYTCASATQMCYSWMRDHAMSCSPPFKRLKRLQPTRRETPPQATGN
jgi:hypothetical protein